MSHDDFATEPIPGLPAHLPEGEQLVWQGAPDARAFARSVLHERKILAYFGIVAVWKFATTLYDGGTAFQATISASFMVIAALVVFAIIRWYANAVAKTTVYTITDKRVVMRFGIALPVTFNYPFAQVRGANLVETFDDHGNITLELAEHSKLSWAILWPHARPWKLTKPEPAMRSVSNLKDTAKVLSAQLHAFHSKPVPRQTQSLEPTKQPVEKGGRLSAAPACPESRI
ncbi:MAG: photosynthetic complex putative assembly protein PuhB [Rhizobiaceae bacterium]|nr:photosynthetic complex putative assembly protein PuhB [Rhizobiaceae bacterium]